jgi:hypothetical protein
LIWASDHGSINRNDAGIEKMNKTPVVRYRSETAEIPSSYGNVQRIVTAMDDERAKPGKP